MTSARLMMPRSDEVLPEDLATLRIVGVLRCAADGTVTDANDAFLQLAGRSREELKAGTLQWNALFSGEPHPPGSFGSAPWQADLNRPDGQPATATIEVTGQTADGYTAWVVDVSVTRVAELTLARAREVLEEQNRMLFGVKDEAATMAEKLTESEKALASATLDAGARMADLEAERKRVEELASRLANANRELDAFSYSVSHDLRAPLRTIDGFSRVLVSSYAPALDDRGRDYLQRIRNATQRMAQLLDDLLKLARTSRAAFSVSTVDLSLGAEQIAAELQQSDPGRKVTWRIESGLVVRADRTLLRVALENLLSNSWKFTSKREHAVIELGCDSSSGTRVFFVRDNGAGFDMTYADQLFGVFQRLHTVQEFEGTGIGLATVQRVIHRHGGEIWADAAADRGATFFFTFGERRPASEVSSPEKGHS